MLLTYVTTYAKNIGRKLRCIFDERNPKTDIKYVLLSELRAFFFLKKNMGIKPML
jgi:hypothetical protein